MRRDVSVLGNRHGFTNSRERQTDDGMGGQEQQSSRAATEVYIHRLRRCVLLQVHQVGQVVIEASPPLSVPRAPPRHATHVGEQPVGRPSLQRIGEKRVGARRRPLACVALPRSTLLLADGFTNADAPMACLRPPDEHARHRLACNFLVVDRTANMVFHAVSVLEGALLLLFDVY
jgi:hypothetical protein